MTKRERKPNWGLQLRIQAKGRPWKVAWSQESPTKDRFLELVVWFIMSMNRIDKRTARMLSKNILEAARIN